VTLLRYLIKNRFSHFDAIWLGLAGHLAFSDRIVESLLLVTIASLTSGILTGIVKAFSERSHDQN
jgi:hypothetical protein